MTNDNTVTCKLTCQLTQKEACNERLRWKESSLVVEYGAGSSVSGRGDAHQRGHALRQWLRRFPERADGGWSRTRGPLFSL